MGGNDGTGNHNDNGLMVIMIILIKGLSECIEHSFEPVHHRFA